MDNQRILQDFLDLVKIDAASGNERGVADAVKAKMAEIGVSLEEDHSGEKIDGNTGNLFGVFDGGLPGSVLLNAHMDRVANGFGIKPVIGDDRIIRSDGTTILAADDLSGVMALIDCARRLKAGGKKFPRVEFLFTIGEETGLFGSKYFDVSKLRSKVGYAFDSPGRMGRVVCAAPGQIKLLIEVEGRAAHAGNCPEDGINATVVLAKILANIRDGRLDPISTSNFAVVETRNKVTNIVQPYACCKGEMRSRDAKKIDEYAAYFEKYCQEAAAGTGAKVTTTVEPMYQTFAFEESAPVVQAAVKALRGMGIETQVNGGGGGMDANNWNAAGIATVGVATGYSGNHGVSEQIYLDDLLKAGELAENIVMTWAEMGLPE